jgi:DNA-binding Xre family transcriptional regulator
MPTGERDIADESNDVAAVTAGLAKGPAEGLAEVLAFPTLGRQRVPEPEPATDGRLRSVIGDVLRAERQAQQRSLADVSGAAAVSLAYLSEVERGRKEISSDLLDAVTDALGITLVDVLERSVERLRARMQRDSGIQLRAA